MISNIPIYRAKSNERKNSYVEGFLIGLDEEIGLCTIRTKEDYIGGEICYLHTLSIHFPDMLDSQGNKIFASLQEDGKGGDILQSRGYKSPCIFNKGFTVRTVVGVCNFYMLADSLKVIGIQE